MLTFDSWRLDRHRRQLHNADGARVALTGAEFDLLLVFCERPRQVLRRDQLIDLTQGRIANPFERSVDILVSRLRQKMEKDPKKPVLLNDPLRRLHVLLGGEIGMRAMLAFLVSAKIGTQIAVLVVGALVLAHVAMAAAFLTLHPIRPEQELAVCRHRTARAGGTHDRG